MFDCVFSRMQSVTQSAIQLPWLPTLLCTVVQHLTSSWGRQLFYRHCYILGLFIATFDKYCFKICSCSFSCQFLNVMSWQSVTKHCHFNLSFTKIDIPLYSAQSEFLLEIYFVETPSKCNPVQLIIIVKFVIASNEYFSYIWHGTLAFVFQR